MKSLCLTMIVRNEAHVIRRCLESVRPYITTWCICDTGSTDGTQDIIRSALDGIIGELHERPWVDQQHNRNEAMELARKRADFLLLIDADEQFVPDPGFLMPSLHHDCYDLIVSMEPGDCEFPRCIFVDSRYPWQWRGKRHPGLYGEGAQNPILMTGCKIISRADGQSWRDPAKYEQHVRDMEAAVADDPDNPRTLYYLAQSQRDAGMLQDALATYERVAADTSWSERTWSALYEAAKLRERLAQPLRDVIAGYLAAFCQRPSRAEPLYQAARYLRERGLPQVGLVFAQEAAAIPKPSGERMFVEPSIYRWRCLDEIVRCAFFAGELLPALDAMPKLIEAAPASEAARFARNALALGRVRDSY